MSVRISFGIIVLNGEPFTRYCIRALYPHAFEIIISEGACDGAKGVATSDGHSSDGTLAILKEIKKSEDPENKITIVTAEDEGHKNGFWPGEKLEQCQAFAKRANGDYLWQIDIDEFYHKKDIIHIKEMLDNDDSITCISFRQFSFWGGFDYIVDSWYFKRYLPEIYRVFKWGKGFQYVSHRPPTVINSLGKNMKDINFLNAEQTDKLGFRMYHYSFVFPTQVREKAKYYANAEWSKRKEAEWWANEVFVNLSYPYRVFSISWVPSWLEPFRKIHPEIISSLVEDIRANTIYIELRKTEDIEDLVNSKWYKTGVFFLKISEPIEMKFRLFTKKIKGFIKKLIYTKK